MEIDYILNRNITTLSGGESQRTALARSLIVEPELILMDEPFSALDISTQNKLTYLIKKIGNELGTTFIHVTHDFNDIWNLADKVGLMQKGMLHQIGSVYDVFSKPENDFVADFVGIRNIFEGILEKDSHNFVKIRLNNDLTLYSNDIAACKHLDDKTKVLVAIRPENIIFSKEKNKSSARNILKGLVTEVKASGPVVSVNTDVCGVLFKGMLTQNSYESLNIEKGKEIYLIFKSLNVNIIDRYNTFKVGESL